MKGKTREEKTTFRVANVEKEEETHFKMAWKAYLFISRGKNPMKPR